MVFKKIRARDENRGTAVAFENTVELRDVTKEYRMGGSVCRALDRVSLTVKKGEFAAVVGTSGSGKSTLLHVLGGVDQPSSGSVKVCGRELYDMDDDALSAFRCKEIGMVFQFFNLIPVLNAEENIAFPVIASGGKPDFGKTGRILKRLGMDKYRFYLPNRLSGGQQQRIAVGRALMNDPAICRVLYLNHKSKTMPPYRSRIQPVRRFDFRSDRYGAKDDFITYTALLLLPDLHVVHRH